MIKLSNILKEVRIEEGVYDPGILKAFFMAGGPGSGKSFIASEIFSFPKKAISSVSYATGLKLVNNDNPFEKGLKDAGYNPADLAKLAKDPQEWEKVMAIRAKAKTLTNSMRKHYLTSRLGMVVDGTGKDFVKIEKYRKVYRNLGYDTYMVFVNTSLDIALERNSKRERRLAPELVKSMWTEVQNNMGKFQRLFGSDRIIIIDNSLYGKDVLALVEKEIVQKVKDPIKNPLGLKWIKAELESKKSK